MKKLLVFSIFSFLLFSHIVSAQAYFQKIDISISLEDSYAYETISATLFAEEELSGLTFELPIKPKNLFVSNNLNYELKENLVTINRTIPKNSNWSFSISFESKELLTKINTKEYLLSYSFVAPSDVNEFILKVSLPENSRVSEKSGGLLVSRPVDIFTDGEKIFLEWTNVMESDDEFTAFVQYKTKEHVEFNYLIPTVLIVLIIGILIGYKFKKFTKEKLIKQVLSEDEKKVVDLLIRKKEILQEELRNLDWSKTKVSKIVRNLELKGIIHKIPYRKTNKLKLK